MRKTIGLCALALATQAAAQVAILKQPQLYQFDKVKKEIISANITRQYIVGQDSMIVKWTLKKGAEIPMHQHPNEQITWITKGSVEVISQGKTYILKAGDVLVIPPNAPHQFKALQNTIDIDYFTPVRQDWLNHQDTYLRKS